MCERDTQEFLYTLCYNQLAEMRSKIDKRVPKEFLKEEVNAQLQIANAIFEQAAGAAVKLEMKPRDYEPIKMVMTEIEEILTWNEYNPPRVQPASNVLHIKE